MSNKTKTDTTTQETKNKLDPRMDALLYGGNGKTGLTQMAYDLMQKPAINDRMRQGMDAQANYLQSPLYSQIFNQILGSGQQLMGRGVAANPFTARGGGNGSASGMMGFGGGGGGSGYSPNYAPAPTQSAQGGMAQPISQTPQTQQPQSQLTPEMLQYLQQMMSQSSRQSNGQSGG